MRAVNLLPADRRAVKRQSAGLDESRRNLLIVCGVVGALIVTGLSVMIWSSSSSLSDKRKQLDALQSQIASTPTESSLQAGLGSRKSTVVGLVSKRLAWDDFLGTISKVMPEDVWLQSMQSTVPGAASALAAQQAAVAASLGAATAPKGGSATTTTTTATPHAAPTASTFTISGYTYSQPSVARMMRRLSVVPWLSDVSLVSSSKTTVGADTLFQFTVEASVVSLPGQ